MDTSNSAKVNTTYPDDCRSNSGKSFKPSQSSISTAMSEALYEPQVVVRPSPLACRVKDAGKEFLKHNQTCQWMQYMMEEDPGARANTKLKAKTDVDPSTLEFSPLLKGFDQLSITEFTHPLDSSTPYEEQLMILQKQQEELQERQRQIELQVQQQKDVRQLMIHHEQLKRQAMPQAAEHAVEKQTQPEPPSSIVSTEAQYTPPVRNRRRLKGTVAQTCAIRDEGSIGSLLWQTNVSSYKDRSCEKTVPATEHAVCKSTKRAESSTAANGRQTAANNESGNAVSQLLSHWPSESSIEVVKSLRARSDSMLSESTVKERDDNSRENSPSTMFPSLVSVTNATMKYIATEKR